MADHLPIDILRHHARTPHPPVDRFRPAVAQADTRPRLVASWRVAVDGRLVRDWALITADEADRRRG